MLFCIFSPIPQMCWILAVREGMATRGHSSDLRRSNVASSFIMSCESLHFPEPLLHICKRQILILFEYTRFVNFDERLYEVFSYSINNRYKFFLFTLGLRSAFLYINRVYLIIPCHMILGGFWYWSY